MFLAHLEPKEKEAFLQIAHHFARSDDHFSDEEKEVIAMYCLEMQISDITYDESKFDLNAALATFKDKRHQKIALLETMALAMADIDTQATSLESLHEGENKVIDSMIENFGLNANLAAVYADWTKTMLILTHQGKNLIEL